MIGVLAVGYGTYRAEGDSLKDGILAALEAGYRHIDTGDDTWCYQLLDWVYPSAAMYDNEHTVAQAISQSAIPREELFITTKLLPSDQGTIATTLAIEHSLKQLQTSYIDLYLIHAPRNNGQSAEEIRRLRQESWMVMEQMHKAGKLRSIGVSNFNEAHIDQVLMSVTMNLDQAADTND